MSFGGQGFGRAPSAQEEIAQFATMMMFTSILKNCFTDCVSDFKVNELNSNEKTCIQNCTKRNAATYDELMQSQ